MLNEEIAKILTEKKLQLAIAESCTGGLISSLMTDVSGSSNFIKQNFVTYSNEAKTKYLGVSFEELEKHGAVSEKVASQMALGLLNNTDCNVALSITGIAGPLGGSATKPVGLVYIGVASRECADRALRVEVFKYNADKKLDRRAIKADFAGKALEYLYNFINNIV